MKNPETILPGGGREAGGPHLPVYLCGSQTPVCLRPQNVLSGTDPSPASSRQGQGVAREGGNPGLAVTATPQPPASSPSEPCRPSAKAPAGWAPGPPLTSACSATPCVCVCEGVAEGSHPQGPPFHPRALHFWGSGLRITLETFLRMLGTWYLVQLLPGRSLDQKDWGPETLHSPCPS